MTTATTMPPDRPPILSYQSSEATPSRTTALHWLDRAFCCGLGLVSAAVGVVILWWWAFGSAGSKFLDPGSPWLGIGCLIAAGPWLWVGLCR